MLTIHCVCRIIQFYDLGFVLNSFGYSYYRGTTFEHRSKNKKQTNHTPETRSEILKDKNGNPNSIHEVPLKNTLLSDE